MEDDGLPDIRDNVDKGGSNSDQGRRSKSPRSAGDTRDTNKVEDRTTLPPLVSDAEKPRKKRPEQEATLLVVSKGGSSSKRSSQTDDENIRETIIRKAVTFAEIESKIIYERIREKRTPKQDRNTEFLNVSELRASVLTSSEKKKRYVLQRIRQLPFVNVFDNKMLPRINPTKSNLVSRLEPYNRSYKDLSKISCPSEESDHGYKSRKTAKDMLDPWEFLDLESVESSRRTIPRYIGNKRSRKRDKNRPPPEGSTYFPKFPSVDPGWDSPTRMFALDDVPKIRKQINKRYSRKSPERVKKDYNKTKQDFYRMELDKLGEMRPTYNRPSMINTYNAYLQNTPGSKQALNDCISGIEGKLMRDQAGVRLIPKQSRVPQKQRQRVVKMDGPKMTPQPVALPNSAG